MGSCYSCNCFCNQRRKTLQDKQQEIEILVGQNAKLHSMQVIAQQHKHKDQNNDDEEDDDNESGSDERCSLDTIRKERDEYDLLVITSYLQHIHRHYQPSLLLDADICTTDRVRQLIIEYTPKTQILLIETGQTEQLQCNTQHTFHSIIINRNATLTTNSWQPTLQTGGTLLLHCISTIHLKHNAQIDLTSKGYKGGHCTYLEDDDGFIDHIHDETDDDEETPFSAHGQNSRFEHHSMDEQQQLNNGLYASYSGESYKGIGVANSSRNNYGGGGAGQIWGSGGGAGYGSRGYIGQYDKQYSNHSCGKGGHCYGSHLLDVLHLGSGGGAAYGGYSGGCGGGALRIECKRLVMDKGAAIKCNGDGGAHRYLSGSGSGGSIHLKLKDARNLQLHSRAKIQAMGGENKELYGYGYKTDDMYNCGRGGYGRIRIETKVNGDALKTKLKNEYKYCIQPVPFIG